MSEAAVGTMLTDTVAEEAKTALGSLITQLINFLRTIMAYVMEIVRRFIAWSGEHPLAAVLASVNVAIWVS